jgi:hypothetical protein
MNTFFTETKIAKEFYSKIFQIPKIQFKKVVRSPLKLYVFDLVWFYGSKGCLAYYLIC